MVAGDGHSAKKEGITEIAVECIVPNPRQPRRSFDEAALEALAESIRQHGLVQPIVCLLYTSPSPRDS